MVNWKKIFEVEEKQFNEMSEREKYVYFLLLQYRSPYLWGRELPFGADCSGAVCLAIAAATGRIIRTTADGLFKKYFTVKNAGFNDIQAVFFVTQYDRQHGDRVAKRGEIVHVAGVIHEGVVMNVVEPKADIRLTSSMRHSYSLMGCEMILRALDRKALDEAAKAGEDLFGLDPEFGAFVLNAEAVKEKEAIW